MEEVLEVIGTYWGWGLAHIGLFSNLCHYSDYLKTCLVRTGKASLSSRGVETSTPFFQETK